MNVVAISSVVFSLLSERILIYCDQTLKLQIKIKAFV